MNTTLVRRTALLVVLAVVGMLPTSSAWAGETVTTGGRDDVQVDRRMTEHGDDQCGFVWWIVVDDLPDVAQYVVELERTSPSPGPLPSITFNEHSPNPWAGTPFDHPDRQEGKRYHPANSTYSGGDCELAGLAHVWEAVSVEITQFTVDPPVPGQAAIEVDLVGEGSSCAVVMWLSVPKIPTAREYRVQYTTGLASGDRVTRLTLEPDEFNSSPRLPDGFEPYRNPRRLGHFLRSATGVRGCTELAWTQLVAGVAPLLQNGVSFEVTTAPCFGRQPTIIAVPGRPTRGTPGADVILGTNSRDVIRGLGGNDRICGMGGNDQIFGGPGADGLDGGSGSNLLDGGPGIDRCVTTARDTARRCE